MTITQDTDTSLTDMTVEPSGSHANGSGSSGDRRRTPTRVVLGWAAVAVCIGTLAVLTYRFITDDDGSSPSSPAVVADPKDRAGYRSPTIQRELTTGDPKDHATYRPALTTWQYTTGDAKDHAGYRSYAMP